MEWLKDKKNLPIVAGLGVAVLLLAIVAILFEMGVIGGPSAAPVGPTASAGGPGAGGPSVAPGAPQVPGGPSSGRPGPPVVPGAAAVAAVPGKPTVGQPAIDVAKGLDPFNAPRPKPVRITTRPYVKPPARQFVPFVNIARLSPVTEVGTTPTNGADQPPVPQILIDPEESATMRVSGIVQTATGVHAVLEANGRSLPVQPGDTIPGGKIVSIQSDGLILRTDNNRTVHVPLSEAPVGVSIGGYPGA